MRLIELEHNRNVKNLVKPIGRVKKIEATKNFHDKTGSGLQTRIVVMGSAAIVVQTLKDRTTRSFIERKE